MKTTRLTVMGHKIEVKGIDLSTLTSITYDEVIDEINDDILNGEDSGSFNTGGILYDWEIYSEKDEEIQNLAYENKMMAEALESLGFTQEQVSSICSGGFAPQVISDEKIRAIAVGMFGGDGSIESCKSLYDNEDEFGICQAYEDWPLENIREEVEYLYEELKKITIPTLVSKSSIEKENTSTCTTLTARNVVERLVAVESIEEILCGDTWINITAVDGEGYFVQVELKELENGEYSDDVYCIYGYANIGLDDDYHMRTDYTETKFLFEVSKELILEVKGELISALEEEAEDDEYRNSLTCNSCASDIDLC